MQEVKKVKKEKKEKKGKNVIARLLIVITTFVFLIYSAITIISQSIQVSQKEEELADLQQQLQIQEIKNEDIKNALNYTPAEEGEYIEQLARQELDYIAPGERVFVNISGD